MPDLSSIESFSVYLSESVNGVSIPTKFRYMQELWIQTRILQRMPETGKARLDLPVPRIWTGYYYLLTENCIFKHGTIEYQNQEIYRVTNFSWNTEVAVNENAFNLSTPEVPPDIDSIDEATEADLWLGTEDLENIYLPIQLPIDFVQFYIPVGCELEVLVSGRRFSPISAFGGDNDIDLYKDDNQDGHPDLLIPTPANPLSFPPMDPSAIVSDFDAIARERGYILPSDCPVSVFNPVWLVTELYTLNRTLGGTTCVTASNIPSFIILSSEYPNPFPSTVGTFTVPSKYRLDLLMVSGSVISLLAGQTFTISALHKINCNVGQSNFGTFFQGRVYRIAP